MNHECKFMAKKSAVIRFTSLPDPMRGIYFNKGGFSVDLLEDTQSGKNRWGLVFYGVKLSYYIIIDLDLRTLMHPWP